MYRKFLNARSPLRLLERGLHGGLGAGNLGVVIAGPGVGKTPFLVGVSLDELLRGGHVLHVSHDATVSHVRAYYDTVFEELAASSHLEDEAVVHRDIDGRRSIRVYPDHAFSAGRLREAVKLESGAGGVPSLIVVEGVDFEAVDRAELEDLRALAGELPAEVWLSASIEEEAAQGLPDAIRRVEDVLSVILTLEPGGEAVGLRALKDHDNPDVSALHVSLDPHSLLLTRS